MSDQLKESAKKVLLGMTLQQGADAVPPGPFAELLKMAAHYGQMPACRTCKYNQDGWCFYIFEGGGEPYINNPTHFCAQWDPK